MPVVPVRLGSNGQTMKEDERPEELWQPRIELRRRLRQLGGERLQNDAELKTLKAELVREQERTSLLENELVSIRGSKMWRFWMEYQAARRALLKIPFVGILLRHQNRNGGR